MGIIFFEGFETCGTETGAANAATVQPRIYQRLVSETGANEGYLIDDFDSTGFALSNQSGSQTNTFHIPLPESVQSNPHVSAKTLIAGFRVHTPSAARGMDMRFEGIENGTLLTDAITLQIVDSTDLVIRRGSTSGTQLGSTVEDAFSPDTWHYVEIKQKIADSGGSVVVNVDGVEVFSFTGDTNVFSAVNPNDTCNTRLLFRTLGHSAADGDFWAVDDIYILDDTSFLGPVRVIPFTLDGDGTPNDWTPSEAADHYTLVDENGADDSDYIESDTDGQRNNFTTENFSGAGTVYAIKVEAEAINTVGGTPNLLVGTDNENTVHLVDDTVDYNVFTHYEDIDGFDDLEIGVEFDSGI